MSTPANDPRKDLWLARLGSALRTSLACAIVGCTTLYGPRQMKHFLTYPAFSYVTTILIVSDATLGDALRGCVLALCATIQVIIPSILTLHVVGAARFGNGLAALAVAANAFLVALPESTPLMAKRIAFGQAVIVYVGTVIHGDKTGEFMHPVHVALSTALGALASVLAMLVPYPRLAYHEVSKARRSYVDNAKERLNLLVEAFTAPDNETAADLISQAKILFKTGVRHLQTIKQGQGGIMWENPRFRFLRHNYIYPGHDLEGTEVTIRGMEMALSSCPSFPVSMIREGLGLREDLLSMKSKIDQKLEKAKCFTPFDARIAPDSKREFSENSLWKLKTIPTSHEDLTELFFCHCMELLLGDLPPRKRPECNAQKTEKTDTQEMSGMKDQLKFGLRKAWNSLILKLTEERWTFVIKCSLALGLAVLFGLIYNKENGYWSGLTIAITFVTGRQATFTVSNARAQGTAMGSVYGILCYFIFQKFEELRLLCLLPWIIFTSFLRHSRMYGQAGAVSAVIGALLILGRKDYGPPHEFAIARLTEASIGLICFIVVEILLQPARAATLTKAKLARSLEVLRDCIANMVIGSSEKSLLSSTPSILRENQKKLQSHVGELKKFTNDAELEPNFWFLPFHSACYRKILGSLVKVADLLLFTAYEIEILSQIPKRLGMEGKELENINDNLELIQESLCNSLKCLEKVLKIQSITALERDLQKKNVSHDPELGKSPDADTFKSMSPDQKEIMERVHPILQQLMEVTNKINAFEGEQKLESEAILRLSGLGFCISNMMKETAELEKDVKELITWENPTRHINLYELFSKIDALHKK